MIRAEVTMNDHAHTPGYDEPHAEPTAPAVQSPLWGAAPESTLPAANVKAEDPTGTPSPADFHPNPAGPQAADHATEGHQPDTTARLQRSTAARQRTRKQRRKENTSDATGRRYDRLSKLLRGIPPEELAGVLRAYPDALKRGTVRALELRDRPPFQARVLDAEGQPTAVGVPEQLVLVSQDWLTWLADERRNARYAERARRGDSTTTEADIRASNDDFDRLFALRQASLKAEQGEQ